MYCPVKKKEVEITILKTAYSGNGEKLWDYKQCSECIQKMNGFTINVKCNMAKTEGCLL